MAHIEGDQDYGCKNNCQISSHFLTAEGVFGPFNQQQIINIEIHAKKNHGNA